MVNTQDNPELQLSDAIFRLLKYFNLLEENVGLCISYLANPADPKATYKYLGEKSAKQKIDWLRDLLSGSELVDDKGLREFQEWCERAKRARSIRNPYVHGHWEYLPKRSEKPVGFRAPAWKRNKPGHESVEMTLDDLEAIVGEMKSIFDELVKFREKYHI
jgi:hypothetical protein